MKAPCMFYTSISACLFTWKGLASACVHACVCRYRASPPGSAFTQQISLTWLLQDSFISSVFFFRKDRMVYLLEEQSQKLKLLLLLHLPTELVWWFIGGALSALIGSVQCGCVCGGNDSKKYKGKETLWRERGMISEEEEERPSFYCPLDVLNLKVNH